jgi:hypothetical protein
LGKHASGTRDAHRACWERAFWRLKRSYILCFISDPRVQMAVKRDEFFKSLLNKRADELLTGARIFVARMDEERVAHSDGRINY